MAKSVTPTPSQKPLLGPIKSPKGNLNIGQGLNVSPEFLLELQKSPNKDITDLYDKYDYVSTPELDSKKGTLYHMKVRSESGAKVLLRCPELAFEIILTKGLFFRYILGEDWLSPSLKTEYERLLLTLFERNELEFNVIARFFAKAPEKHLNSASTRSQVLKRLTIEFFFDFKQILEYANNLEHTLVWQSLHKTTHFYDKLSKDVQLMDKMKNQNTQIKLLQKENGFLRQLVSELGASERLVHFQETSTPDSQSTKTHGWMWHLVRLSFRLLRLIGGFFWFWGYKLWYIFARW